METGRTCIKGKCHLTCCIVTAPEREETQYQYTKILGDIETSNLFIPRSSKCPPLYLFTWNVTFIDVTSQPFELSSLWRNTLFWNLLDQTKFPNNDANWCEIRSHFCCQNSTIFWHFQLVLLFLTKYDFWITAIARAKDTMLLWFC